MIGYLKGNILEVGLETVILEVMGVGYELFCPTSVLHDLLARREAPCEVWVYTHLREDILQLFGFASAEQKDFFLTLLKVNGIGPKMAVSILGGTDMDRIMSMIEGEDVKGLTQLPKVGKKTAEQMILTLKGKLVFGARAENKTSLSKAGNLQLISSALVNFGYKMSDIERILNEFPKDVEVQEGVRRGLQALAKPL